MMAKLLVWSETRPTAIRMLQNGIGRLSVEPVRTNRNFLTWVLSSSTFIGATATVDFVDAEWLDRNLDSVPDAILLGSIGFCLLPEENRSLADYQSAAYRPTGIFRREDPWESVIGWRTAGQGIHLRLRISDETYDIQAWRSPDNKWRITAATRQFDEVSFEQIATMNLVVRTRNATYRVRADSSDGNTAIQELMPRNQALWYVHLEVPGSHETRHDLRSTTSDMAGILTAPMPGTVVKVNVREHEHVAAHEALMVLEAMKMEHVLESPQAGVVIAIHHATGDLVKSGEPLIEIADDDDSKT